MAKIVAYARRDKRSENGILLSNGKPRWVLTPEVFHKYKLNTNDYIPLTKDTIIMRGELQWFRSMGFKV